MTSNPRTYPRIVEIVTTNLFIPKKWDSGSEVILVALQWHAYLWNNIHLLMGRQFNACFSWSVIISRDAAQWKTKTKTNFSDFCRNSYRATLSKTNIIPEYIQHWLIWELFWALFQINKSQVQIIFYQTCIASDEAYHASTTFLTRSASLPLAHCNPRFSPWFLLFLSCSKTLSRASFSAYLWASSLSWELRLIIGALCTLR